MRAELGKGKFPRFLLTVGKLSELPWIQAELSRHLDVGMREVKPLSGVRPDLQVAWDPAFPHVRLPPTCPSAVRVASVTASELVLRL